MIDFCDINIVLYMAVNSKKEPLLSEPALGRTTIAEDETYLGTTYKKSQLHTYWDRVGIYRHQMGTHKEKNYQIIDNKPGICNT